MYKRYLAFLIVLVFLLSETRAQKFFSVNYTAPWTTTGYDIDVLFDNSLVAVNGNAVIKTDSVGNYQWAKYYDFFCKRVLAIDSSIYIFGYSTNDIVIAKLDTAGYLLWCRNYNLSNGSNDFDILNDVICSDNENIIVLSSIFYSDSGALYSKVNIMKLDTAGNVYSSRNYFLDTTSSIAGVGIHSGPNKSILSVSSSSCDYKSKIILK
jgi:hypothetical protein